MALHRIDESRHFKHPKLFKIFDSKLGLHWFWVKIWKHLTFGKRLGKKCLLLICRRSCRNPNLHVTCRKIKLMHKFLKKRMANGKQLHSTHYYSFQMYNISLVLCLVCWLHGFILVEEKFWRLSLVHSHLGTSHFIFFIIDFKKEKLFIKIY